MSFFPETVKPTLCVKPDVTTLSDCLACSGCITSEESLAFQIDTSFLLNNTCKSSIIISKFSKINIFENLRLDTDYETFEKFFIQFIKKKLNIQFIVDTSYFKVGNTKLFSSECPAVVLYVERVYPDLLNKLSNQKTLQQKASDFISEKTKNMGLEPQRIISIQQCYDKKDELKRDNTKIDHFIGTREFYNFIRDDFLNELSSFNKDYQCEKWEISYKDDIKVVSGLENCINIFNKTNSNKIIEDLNETVELRICKSGCYNGPAQVKDKNETLVTTLEIQKQTYFEYETSARVFMKQKKRTFDVEW